VALDTIVAFDTVVAFVIPLVALLMSSGVKNTFGILAYFENYTYPILLCIVYTSA
jgi:hypothetical protein